MRKASVILSCALLWRSVEVDELIQTLDQRSRKAKPPVAMNREIGEASTRLPSASCPRRLLSEDNYAGLIAQLDRMDNNISRDCGNWMHCGVT